MSMAFDMALRDTAGYVTNQDWVNARRALESAEEIAGRDPTKWSQVHFLRARILLGQEDAQGAGDQLSLALEKDGSIRPQNEAWIEDLKRQPERKQDAKQLSRRLQTRGKQRPRRVNHAKEIIICIVVGLILVIVIESIKYFMRQR